MLNLLLAYSSLKSAVLLHGNTSNMFPFFTFWGSSYVEGRRFPIEVIIWVGWGSFFTAFCIIAIRAKFTADWSKNSRVARRKKKKIVEDSSMLCKKRKPEVIGACIKRGGTKPAAQRVTRQWMHESGLFRPPLLELYSTLASWQKIALWIEPPTHPLPPYWQ